MSAVDHWTWQLLAAEQIQGKFVRGSVLCPFAEKRAALLRELRSMRSHGLRNHTAIAGLLAPRHKQRLAACHSAVALLGPRGVLKHTEHTCRPDDKECDSQFSFL
eukprot:872030-Amphidinium_carterae.1